MAPLLPEPDAGADVRERVLAYLDFYRDVVAAKVHGLEPATLRASVLPSGWSPLELVVHLASMERRWFVWGFLGEPVDEPWGDQRDGRWHAPDDVTVDDAVAALQRGGERTRAIVAGHDLSAPAAVGGRFPADAGPPPSLLAICFHVLQEYARHAGHLDVVRELLDGATGEDSRA